MEAKSLVRNVAKKPKQKYSKKNIKGEVARKALPGVAVDPHVVMDLLKQYNGVIAHVADHIGCNRHTVAAIVERYPDVKQACVDARERLIDFVEETYIDKAIKGDSINCAFILKTLGRKRGWVEDVKEQNNVLQQVIGIVFNKSKSPVDIT